MFWLPFQIVTLVVVLRMECTRARADVGDLSQAVATMQVRRDGGLDRGRGGAVVRGGDTRYMLLIDRI